jgi:hypothetical protein
LTRNVGNNRSTLRNTREERTSPLHSGARHVHQTINMNLTSFGRCEIWGSPRDVAWDFTSPLCLKPIPECLRMKAIRSFETSGSYWPNDTALTSQKIWVPRLHRIVPPCFTCFFLSYFLSCSVIKYFIWEIWRSYWDVTPCVSADWYQLLHTEYDDGRNFGNVGTSLPTYMVLLQYLPTYLHDDMAPKYLYGVAVPTYLPTYMVSHSTITFPTRWILLL